MGGEADLPVSFLRNAANPPDGFWFNGGRDGAEMGTALLDLDLVSDAARGIITILISAFKPSPCNVPVDSLDIFVIDQPALLLLQWRSHGLQAFTQMQSPSERLFDIGNVVLVQFLSRS